MSSVWDRILEQKTKEQLLTPPVSDIFKNIPGGSAGLDRTLFDEAFDAVFTRFSLDPNSPDSLVARAGALRARARRRERTLTRVFIGPGF